MPMERITDYISREALLERIDAIWDCADLVFEPNDHCCRADDCASCKWAETKKAIRKIIANFPAADLRPVVRNEKKILDVTCGDRTIWFQKNEPHTIYCDKRREDWKRERPVWMEATDD